MLRGRVGAQLGKWSAICLLALLVGPNNVVAGSPSPVVPCEQLSLKVAEQLSIEDADYEGLTRVEDKLRAQHTTLKRYVAELRRNPEKFENVTRAILAVLQQMKQTRADIKRLTEKLGNDDRKSYIAESQLSDCFYQAQQTRGTPPGSTQVLSLTVLDRTMTVNLSLSDVLKIGSRYRQGIKLPSGDRGASDTTGPVKVDRAVTARATITPGLPVPWHLWLGIGADSKTQIGANLCGLSIKSCDATSGPFPGVRRGLGKGWAAAEGVEVWICRGEESCVGRIDPVATINIHWVLP